MFPEHHGSDFEDATEEYGVAWVGAHLPGQRRHRPQPDAGGGPKGVGIQPLLNRQ